jgi:LEA14-like dessication related protein
MPLYCEVLNSLERKEKRMKPLHTAGFILIAFFVSISGCMEPPIKEPTVSVGEIELADISLQKMTVNTTVLIHNPNPVGAKLNKVVFDIYYLDDTPEYLGHGERSDIAIKENGNTTVAIPVTVGNIQALKALGTMARKGSLNLTVNGSAFVDVKVTSFEMKFKEQKEFQARDFEGYLPVSSLTGSPVNVTEKLGQLRGLLSAVSE